MKKIIKDYLRFTKKESVGLVTLVLIMLALLYLPKWYTRTKTIVTNTLPADSAAVNAVPIAPLRLDSNRKLFPFNPNSITREQWIALGVTEKTANTILNYRSKGGSFRVPTDLYKIWGMPKELADKLLPFIKLPTDHLPQIVGSSGRLPTTVRSLNINTATEADWEALPGIGKVLAARIIRFRDKMGGFKTIEDIAKTYGLSDSVFNAIKPYLQISVATEVTTVQHIQVDINKATEKEMIQAGIDPYLAQAICISRKQDGLFASVADLKRIVFINEKVYSRIVEKCRVD